MNSTLDTIIAAGDDERLDLFAGAAGRLGTAVQNVEKDFWVCWTLDVLFNRLPDDRPRLLFKGGTSLSKAFGLITCFSEDIDVTVFREDIGAAATVEDLEALSGNKQRERLAAIKAACQAYTGGPMLGDLTELTAAVMNNAKIADARWRVEPDKDDPDQQTLLWRNPHWILTFPPTSSLTSQMILKIWIRRSKGSRPWRQRARSGTRSSFFMGCVDGMTSAESFVMAVSAYRAITMTSNGC
jgi:hypothetical protein